MNAIIICDKCNKEIDSKKLKGKRKKVGEYQGELIREVYFKCGKCGERYHITYESKHIKAVKAKMRRLVRMIKNRQGKDVSGEIEDLRGEYVVLQDELRDEVNVMGNMFG